jgi:hypothetical protein
VGVFGKLDDLGNAFKMLPDNDPDDVTVRVNGLDHYGPVTPAASVVELLSLTVVSNAPYYMVDATNCVAVKTATDDWVYVQAKLTTDDINAAKFIQWSGGDEVPGEPFQHRVTKKASAKTLVNATLGPTTKNLTVWILWSTISFQFSGQNPSPISFDPFGLPGNQLGIIYYLTNTFAVGKMCAIATATPSGAHTIVPTGWEFNNQLRMAHCFANGAKDSFFDLSWAGDPTAVTNVLDANDKIYLIDAPSIGGFASSSYEKYANFCDRVTWNSLSCSDTNYFWHFQGKWKADQTPQVTFTEMGGGTTNLPSSSYYSPP